MKKLLNKFKEVPEDIKLELTHAALAYYSNGDYKDWLEEYLEAKHGKDNFAMEWTQFTDKYDEIIIEIHDNMNDLLLQALGNKLIWYGPESESDTANDIHEMITDLEEESKDYLNTIDQDVATPRHLIRILNILKDINSRLPG